MAAFHEATKAHILTIGGFMSLMTGGLFQSDDIDHPDGGGWDWAPKESNGLTIKAHAIMRWGDNVAYQTRFDVLGAERETLEVFMYAPLGGYDTLELARRALKAGLHRKFIAADDRTLAYCLYVFASREIPAEEYQLSPSRFVRFAFIQQPA